MPERCPLCETSGSLYAKAKDIEYFTTNDEYSFMLCERCDVVYIDPCRKDELGLIYPSNYYSFVEGGKKGVLVGIKEWLDARAFRKLIRSIPGESLNVLDVGGGTGWLAGLIRSIDRRVKLTQIVDIDEGARERARHNGHQFFCGRIEDFRTDTKFDLILMLNLIEHVADPVTVLRSAKEMLAPSGRIYIKTPNFRALDASLFRHRSWGGFHCPRHFVLFSKQSFELASQKAGLQTLELSYTQGAPFWAVSLLELLRGMGVARVSKEHPSIYHPLTPLLQAAGAVFDFARKPFSRLSQMIVVLAK